MDESEKKKVDRSGMLAAYDNWMTYVASSEDLIFLTRNGLGRIKSYPQLLQALDGDSERIKIAEYQASKAEKEIDQGFPTLHAHILLGMWGALESFIEDVFVAVLKESPELLAGEQFKRIKLPPIIITEDVDQQYEAIVNAFSRQTSADVTRGVGQFEKVLEAVGLHGKVTDHIRDSIYLAQLIRNVLAHRGGRADKMFVSNAPSSFPVTLGQQIKIDLPLFNRLANSIHAYTTVVINRFLLSIGTHTVIPQIRGFDDDLKELFPGSEVQTPTESATTTQVNSEPDKTG